MICGIFELPFEEVGITFRGGWSAGSYEGIADIDSDGRVVHIALKAYRQGVVGYVHMDVPGSYDALDTFEDRQALILADEIEKAYRPEIGAKLREWISAQVAQGKFERDPGPSQEQRL